MADDDAVESKKTEEKPTETETSEPKKKISVTVKTPKEKENFEVDEDLLVKAVSRSDTYIT